MKIEKIEIANFRLLQSFSIDVEDELSLVIGKNNTGKTSFLAILSRFLKEKGNTFSFDDFSIQSQNELLQIVENEGILKDDLFSLSLKLIISYDEDDNISNISDFILNLKPTENIFILSFIYGLDKENLIRLKSDFSKFNKDFEDKNSLDFLKRNENHRKYFNISLRSLEYKNEGNSRNIEQIHLDKVIKFESISAKRDVSNVDEDSALSKLSFKYFKSTKSSNDTDITDLQRKLIKTDTELNTTYEETFKEIIANVKKFSYSEKESQISILSKLEELNVLNENTSVVYEQDGHYLPEDLNGLGYMNLFAMIFNIHIIMDSFKTINIDSKKPADINLLFIEEPEAHTHPQMQYVFIKNIKSLLKEEEKNLNNLQTIISTHSAHITSQSDFDDIKYFLRENSNIIVKNISELQRIYGDNESSKANFQFLKQYLTLNKAELFFSDKLILIEGDTERILIPAIMKKLDLENIDTKDYVPLLSQNISVTEVGAYSHIFSQFINFLQIKTMIITDIDSVEPDGKGKACPVSKGTHTSNASIRFFTNDKPFNELLNLDFEDKTFLSKEDKWEPDKEGNLRITYQTEENNYHARSFEDAFISLNIEFLKSNKDKFKSLKNREVLEDASPDFYKIANECIAKKSIFAMDILYYSDSEFSEWDIPNYIKEGLLWLAK